MNRVVILIASVAWLLAGGLVYAQVHRIQQGHVLDANMRVGSGGLNVPIRSYDFYRSNRIITGNVTGGHSFRGFSPIGDSSSFFLSTPSGLTGLSTGLRRLPSDTLSNFRRDSYSLGDARRGFSSPYVPYYSFRSTVANTGAIVAGLNRPGTSQVRSSYAVPRAPLVRPMQNPLSSEVGRSTGRLMSVSPQLVRVNTGQLVSGPVNRRLLGSSLFAGFRQVPVRDLAVAAELGRSLAAPTGGALGMRGEGLAARLPSQPIGSPLDRILAGRGAERAAPQRSLRSALVPQVSQAGGVPAAKWPAEEVEPAAEGIQGSLISSPAEAGDVFAQMRSVDGQLIHPLAPGVEKDRGLLGRRGRVSLEQRMATARAVAAQPLKSFVGTEKSRVNEYLTEAESLMKAGQYYHAANTYDLARVIDGRNPLPYLGRAMALLAAGEYLTSVNNLFRAMGVFDSLAIFRIDLKAFIPDVRVLDRRRADLERRLEVTEDYRLRFLLGYAEYCSDPQLQELGLANMAKAVEAAPEEMTAVRRFVRILEQRIKGLTQPIEIPPAK